MNIFIKPAKKIEGEIKVPGDKSISHRLAMIGAISEGDTIIENYCPGEDFKSTLNCLYQLGVEYELMDNLVVIHGKGLYGLQPPNKMLFAGNSGTTMRLLAGILSGQHFVSSITGDKSLNKRPMNRIIEPLSLMGAQIEARKKGLPPLVIRGADLVGINYILPIASAQVKSAILLAGLYAKGITRVYDPFDSRNHTENLLPYFGAKLSLEKKWISLTGPSYLRGIKCKVPGDFSSAAFFIAAALMLDNSHLLIKDVGVNSTRIGLLEILKEMGAKFNLINERRIGQEPIADIYIEHSELRAVEIKKDMIAKLIDELPLLGVIATKAKGLFVVKDATELRYKETDRIKAIVSNLNRIGVRVKEYKDGFALSGPQKVKGGIVDSCGDHRIAMAMAVAALASSDGILIENSECVSISFPNFFEILKSLSNDG